MVAFLTFPDAEAVTSYALRQALTPTGVYSSIPKDPTFPLIVVQRIGGVPANRRALDRARIQVDVWGTNKSEAFDIAAAARVALHEMEGVTFNTPVAAFVSAVEDDLGLTWSPDPVTHRDRYVFGVSVFLH